MTTQINYPNWSELSAKELLEWMRPPGSSLERGLRTFCEQFVRPGMRIIEIGSFAGASSRIILEYLQHGELVCVDTWQLKWMPIEAADKVRMLFELWAHPKFPRVRQFIMSSEEAHKLLAGTYDMVYIDGDHTYEAVKKDLELWYTHIRSGGYIAGHDYSEEYHPEVVRAVDEFFECKPQTVFEDCTFVMQKA